MNPLMLNNKFTLLAVLIASSIGGFAIHHTSVSAQSSQTVTDVTLWDQQIGKGASFDTNNAVADLTKFGFNNKASAIQVNNGQKWRFYAEKNFRGEYIDVGPDEARGNLGKLNNRISSLKSIR
ncbi:beta/gamma crystallin-related protein [Nostoc sp. UHCC 0926]|uniref:beta/gamma crystallin-related protein n=1 Tax=unclassified Nostoc TaxID=2593658 RepID=UPI00235EA14C|nr:beta/gamma crystallin-related protein [Nostoc sp. UHCC 0926]WDD33607.1 beta/gamma crystallin-related protein [Nostoc sp. UHCC 0926]